MPGAVMRGKGKLILR